MATISKNWGTQTWIEGDAVPTWTTLSGTTEEFSDAVNLEGSGYEGAHVIVEIDYDATPTDEVEVKCYGSLDGTDWDDTPIWEMQGDKSVDPQQLSFVVKDLAQFRISFQQTGSTDSHNVRAAYQPWNYASA